MTLNRVASQNASVEIPSDVASGAEIFHGNPSAPGPETSGSKRIPTILRLPAVKAETGYSRSTIYLRMSEGLWPRVVSLGARSVGWPASEVAAINAARIAGKTDNQIRDLVVRLEASRRERL